MIKVGLVYRFRNPDYFSIEKVFWEISAALKNEVMIDEIIAPEQRVSVSGIFNNMKYFRKQQADIFHVTGDIHYAALAFPSGRTLLTVHDCIFLRHPSRIKRFVLKKLWLDWPVRHSRIVTTISEATKKDIIQSSGCAPEKVIVIPDPVDDSFIFSQKEFNREKPMILQVGTWPNKNLERVIEAIKTISCHLHIVGKISTSQNLLLKQSGIDYSSSYRLPQEELIDLYRKSDMVMFATTFEGFGLPILEAQSTGRPVITSNLSPMKEVAGNGACLVDPYDISSISDAVKRIIDDKEYRLRIIDDGLNNIKRFRREVIAEQYLALYRELNDKSERKGD